MNELRRVRPCGGSEVKTNINPVQFLAQTDCFVSYDLNVSPRATRFNLVLSVHVFFSSQRKCKTDCNGLSYRSGVGPTQKYKLGLRPTLLEVYSRAATNDYCDNRLVGRLLFRLID